MASWYRMALRSPGGVPATLQEDFRQLERSQIGKSWKGPILTDVEQNSVGIIKMVITWHFDEQSSEQSWAAWHCVCHALAFLIRIKLHSVDWSSSIDGVHYSCVRTPQTFGHQKPAA